MDCFHVEPQFTFLLQQARVSLHYDEQLFKIDSIHYLSLHKKLLQDEIQFRGLENENENSGGAKETKPKLYLKGV